MDAPEDSTDLAFLIGRIPQYPGYGDEIERRTSDMLVRSYVGEALALARDRFASEIDDVQAAALEVLLLHCQFSDQVFVKRLEHAHLTDQLDAALIEADRSLVVKADSVRAGAYSALGPLIEAIGAAFAQRSALVA